MHTIKPVPAPAPGIYRVELPEYLSWECLDASGAKTLCDKTPAHYRFYRDNPEEAPDIPPSVGDAAFDIGSAWHCLCLEPETFADRFVVLPEMGFRSKEDKAQWEAFRSTNPGKTFLRHESGVVVQSMRDNLLKNAAAARILDLPGRCELSVVHQTLSARGRPCTVKARFDKLLDVADVGDGTTVCIAADLKSTTDASKEGFSSAIANFNYDVQAGLYLLVARECPDLPTPEAFVFIAQEKTEVMASQVFILDEVAARQGEDRVRRAMDVYLDCVESGSWPAYPDTMQVISLPRWAWDRAHGN